MSVFVAAADESDGARQDGPFLYGGFVAPIFEWEQCFVPAWRERVLEGTPRIPHLHMVETRSSSWRTKHGISFEQAERRVDEACRVIGSSGFLHPVRTLIAGGVFREVFATTKVVRPAPQQLGAYQFEPDYIAFLGFAYAAVEWVHDNNPEAKRVDFAVERKSGITHHLGDFAASLASGLIAKNQRHLVRLIGKVIPGGKDVVSLQAADVAMWHIRRHVSGTADSVDKRRLGRMFNLRHMTVNELTDQNIREIGIRSKAANVGSPFKP